MERQWQPTPVLFPGKSHGWRSLVGCSPWGHQESDMTGRLHFHFSLSCIGEGNGNPLQCSCLESPRDGRAWWAGVYGVAQSWTWLKRLSSSSNIRTNDISSYISKKSSGSLEGHFNTFKVLKYFWKNVQCSGRSFWTSVIIKAMRFGTLRVYQTCYAKHFLPSPQDYCMHRFYSHYFTDERAEAEWALNTLPKQTTRI